MTVANKPRLKTLFEMLGSDTLGDDLSEHVHGATLLSLKEVGISRAAARPIISVLHSLLREIRVRDARLTALQQDSAH